MKMKIGAILLLIILTSCTSKELRPTQVGDKKKAQNIVTKDYELIKPESKINGLLILFGGFPEMAVNIKREFQISDMAKENGIAVMLMNFNRKLWLEEKEKRELSNLLTESISENNIPLSNIYIGGFSSGGNVSLLLANYLIESNATIKPKGVFIIDSPVDLFALYNCSKKNVERNFSVGSVQESKRTVSSFNDFFGNPENGMEKYKLYSPYIHTENTIENLASLKEVQIRMYTEPDTTWWKENRMNEYVDMNAYYIKKLASSLKEKFGQENIELIETKNKGRRANGFRHPHSWSIVDKEELIHWILN